MRKYFIFLVLISAAVVIGSKFSNAAKPSDFGLKEGDLISAIFSSDPDVYIINDQGYKRLFLNPEIFKFYAHLGGFANVKLVTPEVRDSFPTSGFFRNCEDNDQKVFGTSVEGEDAGRLHWINKSGDQAVQEDPDFFKKVFCINRKEFNWYPRGNEFKALKEVPQYHRTAEAEKPVICHHLSDDPKTFQTIRVASEALDAHFQHGDTKGACSISSVQQTFPVDVKINNSDTPASVPYNSVFTVSWTSNGAVSCRDLGQFIPVVDGGSWAKFINLPTSGTKSLYARASEGYLATLDIQVQCTNAAGQFSDDVIHLSVQPPVTPPPSYSPTPTPTTIAKQNYISVISPNGWEVWQKGITQLIKWNSANVFKIYIKLRKGNDTYSGLEGMITDVILNDGYFKWTPPTTLPDGNDYSVRVIDGNFTGVLDDSDKQFSIVASATQTPFPSATPTPVSTPTSTASTTFDLAVVDVIPSPAVPEANKDFTVDVVFKNVGQKSITNPTAGLNIYDPNGKIIYSPAAGYIGILNPGATITVKFYSDMFSPRLTETTLNYPAGIYKMVGNINYLGVVDGINYPKDPNPTNDTFTKTLEIKSVFTSTPTPTPTPTSTPTPISCAPINVSISPSTPPAQNISPGQGGVSLVIFDITANCNLNLNGFAVSLLPMPNGYQNISSLRLYNNTTGAQLGSTVTASGAGLNFTGLSQPILSSQVLSLKAVGDISPSAVNSSTVYAVFGGSSASDATGAFVGNNASGNIIAGKTMTIITPVTKSNQSSNLVAFSRNLTLGSTGNDVKQLQALLVNEVSYPVDLITGYFGRITREAVKRLQDKYGVRPISGYFGEITRRALSALMSN